MEQRIFMKYKNKHLKGTSVKFKKQYYKIM